MGKRKSSAKAPAKKQRPKLDTTFSCPFCNAEKSVHCELDRERDVGQVRCTLCGEHWEDKINALSEPIDIYSAWIDACENENKGDKEDEKK